MRNIAKKVNRKSAVIYKFPLKSPSGKLDLNNSYVEYIENEKMLMNCFPFEKFKSHNYSIKFYQPKGGI